MAFMNNGPHPGFSQYAGGAPPLQRMSPQQQAMIDSLMRQRALTMTQQSGQQRGAYAPPGMPPTTGAPMAGRAPASQAAAMAAPYAGGYRPPSNGAPPGGTLQGTIPPGFGGGALAALAGGAGQGLYSSPSSGAGASFASKADAQAAPFAGGTRGTPAGGGTVSGQVPPGMGASSPFAGAGQSLSGGPPSAAAPPGAPPPKSGFVPMEQAMAAQYGLPQPSGPTGGTLQGTIPPGFGQQSAPSGMGAGQGLYGSAPPGSAANNASMLQAQTAAFAPAGQPTTTGAAPGGTASYAAASAAPYGGMPTPAGPPGGTLTGTIPPGFGSGLSQLGQMGTGQGLYGTASPDQTANSASMLQAQLGAFAPRT